MSLSRSALSRRGFLVGVGGAAALVGLPPRTLMGSTPPRFQLAAATTTAAILGAPHPPTAVWAYNGSLPGPEIRFRQGDRLRVLLSNALPDATTIHWHGVRVPNAMDGVPNLTQAPVEPGETFAYEFDLPDAGTYWYHPHQRSFEQVGRGLYGALIVEEPEPITTDRELVWILDDWRLLGDASISEDFGAAMDLSHGGRLGNTVTINGRIPEFEAVRAGERIRLRLINVANARIFALDFSGHRPVVIAQDGHGVQPHEPETGRIVIGPGMRVDLVLDLQGKPGEAFDIVDDFDARRPYRLVTLRYSAERPFREHPLDAPVALAANPLPEPDLATAQRHEVVLGGGMMGGMRGARVDGQWQDMRQMMRRGLMWSLNGVAASGPVSEPMAVLERGRSYRLAIRNDTAWPHPMHLHGHAFRVIARDGRETPRREWQDTVLIAPRESVEVAFVAASPGDWMFHCHVLEHAAAGMMGVVRVA